VVIFDAVAAVLANDAVPNNDPVIPEATVNEFSEALEPDTMTRFHDGILYFLF
jgi:hypothetical protein